MVRFVLARFRWRLVCVGRIGLLARQRFRFRTICGVRRLPSSCWRGGACPGRTDDRSPRRQKQLRGTRTIAGKKGAIAIRGLSCFRRLSYGSFDKMVENTLGATTAASVAGLLRWLGFISAVKKETGSDNQGPKKRADCLWPKQELNLEGDL